MTITSHTLKCYHTLLKQFKDHLHRYSGWHFLSCFNSSCEPLQRHYYSTLHFTYFKISPNNMQLVCRLWTNSLLDLWVTYVKKEWKYLYIYFLVLELSICITVTVSKGRQKRRSHAKILKYTNKYLIQLLCFPFFLLLAKTHLFSQLPCFCLYIIFPKFLKLTHFSLCSNHSSFLIIDVKTARSRLPQLVVHICCDPHSNVIQNLNEP